MTTPDAPVGDAHPVVAAVDHAIGRLATDVTRLDGIDLDAPWSAEHPSRRDRLATLIGELDPDAVPTHIEHGHEASAALIRAWSAHREASGAADVARNRALLGRVRETHVALDVGMEHVDLPDAV